MSRLITKADVLFALGFTPYDAANPLAFITPAQVAALAPLAAPQFTGSVQFGGPLLALALVDVQSGALQLSSNAAVLTLGKASQAGTPLLRFLSSGFAARNYDAQFSVTGGSAASDGKGVVNLVCNGFTINGQSIAWGTASPSVSLPLSNGPAALLGNSLNYAREDHVHQSDSTRAAATNPTLDGTVSLGTNTQAALTVQLNGTTASNRRIRLMTAGSVRWTFGVPAGSEPGSNAGSDFNVNSYDDSGTILSPVPMVIRRSDGRVTFGGAVVMGGALSGVTTLAMGGALSGVTTYAGSAQMTLNFNTAAVATLPPVFNTTATLRLNSADNGAAAVLVETNGSVAPIIGMRRQTGTGAVPVGAVNNDTFGAIAWYGYDTATFASNPAARIECYAAGTWSGTNHPSTIRFSTTAASSTTPTERMRLWSSGNLTIQPAGGTFTDDNVNALQVAGGITATGALTLSTANTGIDIGAKATSNAPFLDFNSSGFTNDYDVRLQASGGTNGVVGKGNVTVTAGSITLSAPVSASDLTLLTDAAQSAVSGAWSSQSATVAATSGTWAGTGVVRYKKIGRMVFFNVGITGITNTSGAGGVTVTLPFANFPPASGLTICTGRDNTTGKTLQGYITSGTATLSLIAYDGTFPSGTALYASGVYEATT